MNVVRMETMRHRWLFILLYALHLIWTGLLANIQAQAYKPNALWFCLILGFAALAGAYLFRLDRTTAARWITGPVIALVFGFYLYSFIKDPAVDATMRVGLILLASVAAAAVVFLPAARSKS